MINITKSENGWTAEIDGLTAFIPNDPENEQCREVMALIEGGLIVAEANASKTVVAEAITLSKIDFCRALYAAQILPADLVVDAARGKWPSTFEAAIAGLPEAEQVDAKLAWAGAESVRRNAPLFLSLLGHYAKAMKLSDAKAVALGDKIFGIGDGQV